MQTRFIDSVHRVEPHIWDAVCGEDYPFLRHGFFAALEDSKSTTRATGWQPHHLVLEADERVLAIMPLFLKHHSYGEYVFDWAWADAYHRSGLDYYPKLLSAIPFTPATGKRWGIVENTESKAAIEAALFAAIETEAERLDLSGQHFLFPEPEQASVLSEQAYLKRTACQYHWFNRGFGSFDDFLATFSSRKRKNVNKERRTVTDQGLTLEVKEGSAINEQDWQNFFLFYHLTYFKRSGRQGYLTESFFPLLAKHLSEHLVMVCAHKGSGEAAETVAAALYFRDSTTLYGRYWGCKQEYDMLHFEACYYQGIEYAIANGLQKFDPGAQGEHKIQRGFTPTPTCSYHRIADSRFEDAIARFLREEAKDIAQYTEALKDKLPFKESE